VDLDRLAKLAGARTLRLAGESELRWLYPDCEPGAMPPLGPLYNQPVFVDRTLTVEHRIAFPAGTHAAAVAMRYEDFAAITHPIVGRFARRPLWG
jgi:Ala-tRNA(Pro) deacylase